MQLISQIDRTTWDTDWENYYTERTNILNAIANATQINVDAVNTTATTTNKNLINLANEVGYDITTNTLTQNGLNVSDGTNTVM
ncbi:MAG: hypothetical protein ABF633_17770 [Clostridium sp.]|uniref:hypothetical protein n=1 Tax=Clostridium sp. TaxID=1506 RepID=UPI0039E771ED